MNPSLKRNVLVGLFVLVAVLIFTAGIMSVGKLNDTFSRKITIHTVFSDVNGLKTGSNVWNSGLKIGVVSGLEFVDTSRVQVSLQVNTDAARFIHNDAIAKIGADGLIGNTIVVLTGGSAEHDLIVDGDMVEGAPPSGGLGGIMEWFDENKGKVSDMIADLKVVSGRLSGGEGTVGKLLKEDELYASLNATVADLHTGVERLNATLSSADRFAAELNKPGQLPHELVTNTDMVDNLRATLANIEQTIAGAREVVADLSQKVGDTESPIGALMGDRQMGTDLKQTIPTLNGLIEKLQVDAIALRCNFLFRPYFKKNGTDECKKKKPSP